MRHLVACSRRATETATRVVQRRSAASALIVFEAAELFFPEHRSKSASGTAGRSAQRPRLYSSKSVCFCLRCECVCELLVRNSHIGNLEDGHRLRTSQPIHTDWPDFSVANTPLFVVSRCLFLCFYCSLPEVLFLSHPCSTGLVHCPGQFSVIVTRIPLFTRTSNWIIFLQDFYKIEVSYCKAVF